MSFTEKFLPVQRYQYFTFFATGSASINVEQFIPSFDFELEKIRLRFSTAFASVQDFMVTVSHHLGSQYNHNLVSQALNGVQDVLFHPDRTIKYHVGDTIQVSILNSAENAYGLEIAGWAITSV
jgi:hypothetical protein